MSRLKIPLFPQICAHRTHPTQKSTPVSFLYSRPTYRVGTWNIPTLQHHHSSSFQHFHNYSSLQWNFTVLVNYTRELVISVHRGHVQTEKGTFSKNLRPNRDFIGNCHFGTLRTCLDWKFHFFHKFVPTIKDFAGTSKHTFGPSAPLIVVSAFP